MPRATSATSPLTFGLIVEINEYLAIRGKTREWFRDVLNEFLPESRKVKSNHSGTVHLNRWLNPTGSSWVEPKGEITLAMSLSLKKLQKNP